jgi:hypothetical protein
MSSWPLSAYSKVFEKSGSDPLAAHRIEQLATASLQTETQAPMSIIKRKFGQRDVESYCRELERLHLAVQEQRSKEA